MIFTVLIVFIIADGGIGIERVSCLIVIVIVIVIVGRGGFVVLDLE